MFVTAAVEGTIQQSIIVLASGEVVEEKLGRARFVRLHARLARRSQWSG